MQYTGNEKSESCEDRIVMGICAGCARALWSKQTRPRAMWRGRKMKVQPEAADNLIYISHNCNSNNNS